MIPIVATLVTLGLSWALGVFDVERKRIEVSANLLEIRRAKLTGDVAKRDGLAIGADLFAVHTCPS
jgi:hypothetical protein